DDHRQRLQQRLRLVPGQRAQPGAADRVLLPHRGHAPPPSRCSGHYALATEVSRRMESRTLWLRWASDRKSVDSRMFESGAGVMLWMAKESGREGSAT